jgi:hypothetical protein
MASKLHWRAMTTMARVLGALLLGPLVLACQGEGSGGTQAAAQHAAHPTATAVTAAKAPPAVPVPPGPGPFAPDRTDRALAATIAAAVQRAFTPPPGSRKLSGPPAGTWRDVGVPGGVIPADGEVFVSSWWKVPGQPQAVLKWLLAHEPRPWYGGGRGSSGPVGEPGDAQPAGQLPADVYQEWSDTFENFHEPAVIGATQLIVEEIRNGAGQTYTRVDSVVTWIIPRPLAERVPASARVVTITAEPMPGTALPPGSPATVTSPAAVARIASLINGLYRAGEPCAPPPPAPDRIKLTFSAAPGGPLLATADADLRGCRQVRFSAPGSSSLPLLTEVNDRLVPAILAAAGLSWFS